MKNDHVYEDRYPHIPRWLVFIIFLMCPAAWGADTFSMSDHNGKLTLMQAPCKIHPWFSEWKVATWSFRGQNYDACWQPQHDYIIVMDSSGVMSAIDIRDFKRDVVL